VWWSRTRSILGIAAATGHHRWTLLNRIPMRNTTTSPSFEGGEAMTAEVNNTEEARASSTNPVEMRGID
jgi:hypothetical protein